MKTTIPIVLLLISNLLLCVGCYHRHSQSTDTIPTCVVTPEQMAAIADTVNGVKNNG